MLRRYSTTIRRSEYVLDFLINVLILGVLIKSSKYFELNLHTIFSFAVLFVVGQILIFRVLGLYGSRRFRSLLQQLVLITTSILIHAVLVSVFYAGARFFLDFSLISYIKLLMTYYLVAMLLYLVKGLLVKSVTFYWRTRGYNSRYVLLVGEDALEEVVLDFEENSKLGIAIIGYISSKPLTNFKLTNFKLNYLGDYTDFEQVLNNKVVDQVVLVPGKEYQEQYQKMMTLMKLHGKEFHIYKVEDSEPFKQNSCLFCELGFKINKRVFDLVVSLMLLFFLAPLLLVVALAIKLTSSGPVFFKQKRMGKNRRLFVLYKFRSMCVDADKKKKVLMQFNEMQGPAFKMKNDPRVTKIGSFLRKTSLDELPQLINVLRGEMSLVGPRPPLPAEVKEYDDWHNKRLSIKPGITCIWQVSGRNEIQDFDDWVNLDLEYIKTRSFMQDIKLLVKTISAVFKSRGAS